MSDVLDGAVAPVAPETPSAEPIAENTEATAASTEEKTEETKEPEKSEKTFTQAELDEIVRKRLAKEQRRLERTLKAETEAAFLRQQLQAKEAPPPADGEPKRDDYASWDEWNRATVDWQVKQGVEQRLKAEREQAQRSAQERAELEFKQQAREKLAKGIEKYDDFAEVVFEGDHNVTDEMAIAIAESSVAAELAYWLGKNPAESNRIANLPPASQIRELGKIEARLEAPKNKTTSAPEPVSPVKGSASGHKRIEDMTMAEYKEFRKKQGARIA